MLQHAATPGNSCRRIAALEKVAGSSPVGHPSFAGIFWGSPEVGSRSFLQPQLIYRLEEGNMRRSKGKGSVYKRKDGSWCAQYHDGNKRRYIYGKKKQVVTDRLRKPLVALENGTVFGFPAHGGWGVPNPLALVGALPTGGSSTPSTGEHWPPILHSHCNPPLHDLLGSCVVSLWPLRHDAGWSSLVARVGRIARRSQP